MKTSIQNKARESTSQLVPLASRPQALPRVANEGQTAVESQLDSASRLGHRFDAIDVQPALAAGSAVLQRQGADAGSAGAAHNASGLPQPLKTGIENLSGTSLDDVRVHYNSPKPADLEALAYTQGSEIHVGPGHEQHLPHEAWHVVQQKQGRVKATRQVKGRGLNDSVALEHEAEAMGRKSNGESTSEHGSGCGCSGCQQFDSQESTSAQGSHLTTASNQAIQLMCNRGHKNHGPGPCPDASGHIKNKILNRIRRLGVKLGQYHKQGSEKPQPRRGEEPRTWRETTPKVEERLTRHMNAALRGEPSKARITGMAGSNIAWTVDRATREKQESEGPRHVLQHTGGGGNGDPLDYFEDEEAGDMSETEGESEDYYE